MRFGILTAAAAAILAGFGAADDYPPLSKKCNNWNFPLYGGQTWMQGFCASNNTQGVTCSEMDLNACYANMNGTLVAATNGKGDFYQTCSNCTNVSKMAFQCRCWGTDGNGHRVLKDTQVLDLDEHIHVKDNRLGCVGYEGEYCCGGKRCPDPDI